MKKLLSILFFFTVGICFSQINFDSLDRVLDTVSKPKRKIEKLYKVTLGKKLSKSELNLIEQKINEIGHASGNQKNIAYGAYRIGSILFTQRKYNEAIRTYFNYLQISERLGDSAEIGFANYELGETYTELKNYPYAKKHLYYSIKFYDTSKYDQISTSYNQLGTIFKNEGKLDSALSYHEKSIRLRLRQGNKRGLAASYNNLALVYKKKKDYENALTYLRKSLALKKELDDKKGQAGSLINIGNALSGQKKYKESIQFTQEGVALANSIKEGTFFQTGIENLAMTYYDMKDFKNAAIYFSRYKVVKDSLVTDEINKQISELTAEYESGKKDSEIALQEEQIKSQNAANQKQKMLTLASIGALLMALVAVLVIYRSFKQNKRNAIQLASKNELIEVKNKEITDSINYARVIQQSLLAPQSVLDSNLKEYFILYKPKDIVSGDFYWGTESKDGFTLACVDCTGHGVPGAFMSLIGKENLDKAVSKTSSPQMILSELNRGVKSSLNQNSENGTRDGMDAAIARLQKQGSNTTVSYAGANRPLWIIRENALAIEEIKATKQAIGGFTANDQAFKEHKVDLKPGDSFYLFTDGYADQFGGEKHKKLTTKLFKELLLKFKNNTLKEQKQALEDFFTSWQGQNEQVDDILVIGVRV